ncbi:perforin-1 [Gallus gallus]|uniref:perforin-1 n=1 Tax=Gallus gallus TaxID=9031 RepID=UPI001AE4655B|nr:perforin-1 [Gallus gallus]
MKTTSHCLAFSILLLFHHLPTICPQCHRAVGKSCQVPPVPGTDILGSGLDVTTMSLTEGQVLAITKPTSRHCVVCVDRLHEGRSLLLYNGISKWRAGSKCRKRSSLATGRKSMKTLVSQTEKMAQNWKVGLRVALHPGMGVALAVAGSHSRVAEFGMQKEQEDRYSFASTELHCVHYWISASHKPRPSSHFLHAVRSLPPHYTPTTAPDYADLLAAYGTHYIHSAQLGGLLRSITAIRSCRAAMMGAGTQEVADCLSAEMTANMKSAAFSAMSSACRKAKSKNSAHSAFHQLFDERMVEVEGGEQHGDLLYGPPENYAKWLSSLQRLPGLVASIVRPLHTLLPPQDPRQAALKAAVSHYIAWRALRVNCSQQCAGHSAVGLCQCGCAANNAVSADCCSKHRGMAQVTVTVLEGSGWRGDFFTPTDAYVLLYFNGQRVRTATVWNNNRPRWGARFDFGWVMLHPHQKMKVEVWDQDNGWNDDRLGVCELPVQATGRQQRNVVCFPGGGHLKLSYSAMCGPSLGGSECSEYIPQPPKGQGGLYRLSQWPPKSGDVGPVAWPQHKEGEEEEQEEEEEEEEEEEQDNFWEVLGVSEDNRTMVEDEDHQDPSSDLQNPSFNPQNLSVDLKKDPDPRIPFPRYRAAPPAP